MCVCYKCESVLESTSAATMSHLSRYTMLTQCWAALPEDRPSFTDLCTQLKEYWDDEHLYVVQSFK